MKEDEVDGKCRTHGGDEKSNFRIKPEGKETTWKTLAYVGG
jgi:hypothetical protein